MCCAASSRVCMPNFAAVCRAVSEEIGDREKQTELFYSIRYSVHPGSTSNFHFVALVVFINKTSPLKSHIKVIQEECIATPHGREWTYLLHVLAVQCHCHAHCRRVQ